MTNLVTSRLRALGLLAIILALVLSACAPASPAPAPPPEEPATAEEPAAAVEEPAATEEPAEEPAAAVEEPAAGEPFELVMGVAANISGLHPNLTSLTTDWIVLEQIMDPLIVLGPDGTFQPWLAKEWSVSEDGLTWTFTLKEGIASVITKEVPEIAHVVDETEHAHGANPYYSG